MATTNFDTLQEEVQARMKQEDRAYALQRLLMTFRPGAGSPRSYRQLLVDVQACVTEELHVLEGTSDDATTA
jgi:hypothetical protein